MKFKISSCSASMAFSALTGLYNAISLTQIDDINTYNFPVWGADRLA